VTRSHVWAAWALAGLAIAFHVVSHVFVLLGIGVGTPGDRDVTPSEAGFVVAFYAYPLVGAVIATRRPENAIGWLFLATGIVLGLDDAAASYSDYALFTNPGALPGGVWAAWTVSWLDPAFFFFVVLLVLLFPSGRLPSRRWRPVLVALVVAVIAGTVTSAIEPGLIFDSSLPVENPAGVETARTARGIVSLLSFVTFIASAALTVVGAVLRFRSARGVERQQFKWFVLAACFLVASLVLIAFVPLGLPEQPAEALVGLAFAGVAVSVGIAILRYRLFEIDRVISRTLVYATLTTILVAVYVGLVLAGQTLFSSFAGGSNLAIAVSTLVVAALFLPLRTRVQRVVDRRFYRSRYNAQRTLDGFGARLREQVELELLAGDLRSVVAETMQPTETSLWLRPGGGS
jgi:hypothetical protein